MFSETLLATIVGVGGIFLIFMTVCIFRHFCIQRRRDAPRAPRARGAPDAPEAQPLTPPLLPPLHEIIDLDQMEASFGFGFGLDTDSLGLTYGAECSICCEIMDGRSTIGKIRRCKHSFHRACIMRWYQTRIQQGHIPSCPTCRDTSQQQLILTKVLHI